MRGVRSWGFARIPDSVDPSPKAVVWGLPRVPVWDHKDPRFQVSDFMSENVPGRTMLTIGGVRIALDGTDQEIDTGAKRAYDRFFGSGQPDIEVHLRRGETGV